MQTKGLVSFFPTLYFGLSLLFNGLAGIMVLEPSWFIWGVSFLNSVCF